jgi:sugar-specific transcriptional regulator TrmB
MTTQYTKISLPRPLEVLGIEEGEERVYRTLLTRHMITATEAAKLLSLSVRKTQFLLDSIERKGLATHSPERPRRYMAAPPELAVEALAMRRRAEIERACSSIAELKQEAALGADNREREQTVELITSRDALIQILIQMRQTMRNEGMVFQTAPILYSPAVGGDSSISAGAKIRTISDQGYVALPGALASLRSSMDAGEEARIFPVLPVKMFIADRRIGLIPLNPRYRGGATLLVRSSALLDALCALFDLIWERSTPIEFSAGGKMQTGALGSRVPDIAEELIPLLAAGLNDKAVAHEADISAPTLTRRINMLMKLFKARTRFQLGWSAALHAYPERMDAKAKSR